MPALDILNQLQNSLNGTVTGQNTSDKPRALLRYSGGHQRTTQPHITGYFVVALMPPPALFGSNAADAEKWFHATCESFTPPSKTLLKVDVPGMGGLSSSFVAGQEWTRTFTLAFREFQGMPILKMLQAWTSAIENTTGFAPTPNFIPSEYKGAAIVASIKPVIPNGKTVIDSSVVELGWYFEGVFPETLPWDALSYDIQSSDTIQISTSFSFDGAPKTTAENPQVSALIDTVFQNYDFTEYQSNHIDQLTTPY